MYFIKQVGSNRMGQFFAHPNASKLETWKFQVSNACSESLNQTHKTTHAESIFNHFKMIARLVLISYITVFYSTARKYNFPTSNLEKESFGQ